MPPRNINAQLHNAIYEIKKQALNAQKCNMILAGALSMYRPDIWWRYSFSNTLSNPTPAVKPIKFAAGLESSKLQITWRYKVRCQCL